MLEPPVRVVAAAVVDEPDAHSFDVASVVLARELVAILCYLPQTKMNSAAAAAVDVVAAFVHIAAQTFAVAVALTVLTGVIERGCCSSFAAHRHRCRLHTRWHLLAFAQRVAEQL